MQWIEAFAGTFKWAEALFAIVLMIYQALFSLVAMPFIKIAYVIPECVCMFNGIVNGSDSRVFVPM